MFKDRIDAGKQLAEKLLAYKNTDSIVLAVPRGGVPVGKEIAKALNVPLDIILSKKIGHPLNSEFAVGAVSPDAYHVDQHPEVTAEYIEAKIKEIREDLERRSKLFRKDKPPPRIEGKNVILVDDGIATGNTLLATIRMLRKQNPKKIIVAIPIAPLRGSNNVRKESDEYICLEESDYFPGVGAFYLDFPQVSDDEVISMLQTEPHIES